MRRTCVLDKSSKNNETTYSQKAANLDLTLPDTPTNKRVSNMQSQETPKLQLAHAYIHSNHHMLPQRLPVTTTTLLLKPIPHTLKDLSSGIHQNIQ